ncbi:MAG: carbohydrate porin, partial [Methylobacteriaceae bacterium]|nr:carbohydrate porin [Methylobacteriaceae bacterium]
FRLSDPAFILSEASYTYALKPGETDLPGTVKLGYWHHLARFNDQRFDVAGLSLADPASSGVARRLRGNDGGYLIVDQALTREAGSDQGLSAFLRVFGHPADRNVISFYVDAGLAYKGLIPGRDNDTAGVSFGFAQISPRAAALDRDGIVFSGNPGFMRSYEAVLEVTYQAEIVPGWTVQPDFQYIFNPGGGIANPRDPLGRRIGDAAIFGARTTIRY